MMSNIEYKGLEGLIKKVDKLKEYLQSQNGKTVNLNKQQIFVSGPYLHQDSTTMTKEESLRIEQENPDLFAFRRAINDTIRKILK